jgi:hypothetical protein
MQRFREAWALVLAAGDGSRLRSLTTRSDGEHIPEQFARSVALAPCSGRPLSARKDSWRPTTSWSWSPSSSPRPCAPQITPRPFSIYSSSSSITAAPTRRKTARSSRTSSRTRVDADRPVRRPRLASSDVAMGWRNSEPATPRPLRSKAAGGITVDSERFMEGLVERGGHSAGQCAVEIPPRLLLRSSSNRARQ